MPDTPDGWQVFKYALITVLLLLLCVIVIYLGLSIPQY